MNDLLLRSIRGDADPDEEEQVRLWRMQSRRNARLFKDLEYLYAIAQEAESPESAGHPPTAKDIIFRAEARGAHRACTETSDDRFHRTLLYALGIAASVLLLGLGLLAYQHRSSPAEGRNLAAEEFVTGTGESTTIRLDDGSVVRLGPESRLYLGSSGSARELSFEGRAFFAVAADDTRPFRVNLPAAGVRVLGTRFHLEADASDTRLIVVEGSVALTGVGREVHVREGQMTQHRVGSEAEIRQAPSLAELSADWMGQFLVFQHTPLWKAAQEIERLYGAEVRIDDQVLRDRTLTMWFWERSLEEVMTVVCAVADATCQIEEGVVIMAAHGIGR